ncbi:MAG: CoA pyrophosphatase [Xanthomonadaceae bacterium]|nr:CoA pyrophosphatase [Xanthomonadaceae bacterium]
MPEAEFGRFSFARHLFERDRLRGALYPLNQPPAGKGWNWDDLTGLLPSQPLAEAAVLVGLVPRSAGTQVLLTRRNENLRHHGGQVSFPGGRCDHDDSSVIAAALRESSEEVGLRQEQVAPLGYLDPFVTISGFRVTPVVATVDPAYIARPAPAEVTEVFEVPLDYLMTPGHLRRVNMEYRGRPHTVLEYDWPGQRIWGATAAILSNLRWRMERTA